MTTRRSILLAAGFLATASAGLLPIDTALAATNTLTIADRSSYKDWDPAAAFSEEVRILGNLYETLLVYNPPGSAEEFTPALATSWADSDDGKTWTFKLREGVKFHDGTPFNATAAKKSLEYVKNLGKGAAFVWGNLESVETPDEYTLVLKFGSPTAADLIVSGQYAAYMIAPSAIDKGHEWLMAPNAVGTGPYKLVQVEPGQQIVMERFDDYWGGWRDGQFDRVIVKVVSEAATRVQMLQSGEIDYGAVPTDQLDALASSDGVSVITGDSWKNSMFLLNTSKPPTDNAQFRKALQLIWDYDNVINSVYAGYARLPKGPLPVAIWGHGEFDMPKQNLEQARKLLEESGVAEKDWKVTMQYIGDFKPYADGAELFQATAAQVGVEVELLPGAWGVIWDKAKNRETAPNMQSMTWWPTYATPTDWLVSLFKTEENALFNLSHYSNAEYDKLVDEGIKLEGVNRNQATEKFVAAQAILMQDAPAIFYGDIDIYRAFRSDLSGMEANLNPAYEATFYYKLSR